MTLINTDLLNILENIEKSLYESEKQGQSVIILSHIPLIGDTYIYSFERSFNVIVE